MATLILALLRTLDRLSWMGLFNVGLITLAGLVAMAVSGAGLNPDPDRVLRATVSTHFFGGDSGLYLLLRLGLDIES